MFYQNVVETLVGSLLIVFSLIEHDCRHIVLHSGLMVRMLISGLSGLGWSPGQGHWILFLAMGKTLHSHSTSFHPGV